jgi:hypothetical protein
MGASQSTAPAAPGEMAQSRLLPMLLAPVLLLVLACGGDQEERRVESASIEMGTAGAADVASSHTAYAEWARDVCLILEGALIQFESVSVASEDLATFFRSASGNSLMIARELTRLDAPSETETFLARAAAAYEELAPLLERTAVEIDAALAAGRPEGDTLAVVESVVASQEPVINAVLGGVRNSAMADLPLQAQRALSDTRPCGSIHRQ